MKILGALAVASTLGFANPEFILDNPFNNRHAYYLENLRCEPCAFFEELPLRVYFDNEVLMDKFLYCYDNHALKNIKDKITVDPLDYDEEHVLYSFIYKYENIKLHKSSIYNIYKSKYVLECIERALYIVSMETKEGYILDIFNNGTIKSNRNIRFLENAKEKKDKKEDDL